MGGTKQWQAGRTSRCVWELARNSAEPEQGCLGGVGREGGERRLGRALRVKQWRVLVPNEDTFILQWELSRICRQRRENVRVGVSLELIYLGHLRSVHLHTLSQFP